VSGPVIFISDDNPELKLVAGHDRPPTKDGSGVIVDPGTYYKDLPGGTKGPGPNDIIEFTPWLLKSGSEESGNLIYKEVGVAELTDETKIRFADKAAETLSQPVRQRVVDARGC
jgi:hypothetical protein